MGKSLKGKELGKGITQRKEDGLYVGRFTNRFGKRQLVSDKTYNGVCKKLRDAQYEDAKQTNVCDSKMTLNEWFDVWLDTCKKNCRDTTKRTYTIVYNRIRDELGWRKLNTLNLVIIQKAINNLKSDASREDCRAVLVDMLNRAMSSDLIIKNPAIDVNTKIDCKEKEEREVLTSDEINLLKETMQKGGYLYPIMMLLLNTGMRLGELLGLTWDCVDFKKNVIYVRKNLVYLPNNGQAIYEFHPPKTAAGKRNIPMTKEAKDILIRQQIHKNKINARHKAPAGFENLVFTSRSNKPLHESNIRSSFKYYINKINKEHDGLNFKPFTPHNLRHTFASDYGIKGINQKVLQKLMGHNSMQMTNHYCHVSDDTVKNEMAHFAEMA